MLVAGLAVQVAGVGVFLLVLGRFTFLVKQLGSKGGGWGGLLVAVWVSSGLIFVSTSIDWRWLVGEREGGC